MESRRFGVGAAVYLPVSVVGFPVGYYYEWVIEHTWKYPWSGLGWSIAFLAIGFSADLTYLFLPARFIKRLRAIIMGIVMECASFVLTVTALMSIYTAPIPTGSGSFWGVAYFGLPWLIVNSAFGGYTAYAISRNVEHHRPNIDRIA